MNAAKRAASLPLTASPYQGERGHWKTEHILTTADGRRRWHVGYIDERGSCRRVHGGPVEPGPYAYAFEAGWAMTADPARSTAAEARRKRAEGSEFEVEEGDLIRLGWDLFEVRICRRGYVTLEHVGSQL